MGRNFQQFHGAVAVQDPNQPSNALAVNSDGSINVNIVETQQTVQKFSALSASGTNGTIVKASPGFMLHASAFKHGAIDAIGYMDRIQADIARAQQPLTQDDKVVLCVGAGLSIFMVIVAFFVA